MEKVNFEDLGRIGFKQAWAYQEKLFKEITDLKISRREASLVLEAAPGDDTTEYERKHYLLYCEHFPVYTLGKNGEDKNLLISEKVLKEKKIDFYRINRGGDITYHGPGQVVGYPILDLDFFFSDIHKYLHLLEENIIRTLADFDIFAGRRKEATGVWLDADNPLKARKICAIGIRCSRWVTMHGFAFNVNTNLDYYDYIVPCGILDKAVTSMQKELGRPLELEAVKKRLKYHFSELFAAELI